MMIRLIFVGKYICDHNPGFQINRNALRHVLGVSVDLAPWKQTFAQVQKTTRRRQVHETRQSYIVGCALHTNR